MKPLRDEVLAAIQIRCRTEDGAVTGIYREVLADDASKGWSLGVNLAFAVLALENDLDREEFNDLRRGFESVLDDSAE